MKTLSHAIRLVWHRRDLRLMDNPLYFDCTGCNNEPHIVSLYVFDESHFTPRPSTCLPSEWDTVLTGPHASRVLVESVAVLRRNVERLGGLFLVRQGNPVEIIPFIAAQLAVTHVSWAEEPGVYEVETSRCVRRALEAIGIAVSTHVGYTLYHPDDLPRDRDTWSRLAHPKQKAVNKKRNRKLKPNDVRLSYKEQDACLNDIPSNLVEIGSDRWIGMPLIMGDFRRAVRTFAHIRPALSAPQSLVPPPNIPSNIDVGVIPSMLDLMKGLSSLQRPILGMDPDTIDSVLQHALNYITGDDNANYGETSALDRLHFFVENGYAATADRSLADVSGNNSSRLSVHLAIGTLSPRTIYETVATAGEGSQWLISHMEMRDFFIFSAFAAGSKMFRRKGIPVTKVKQPTQWQSPTQDPLTKKRWQQWALGSTNLPLVDAGMRELLKTGYCSNRVRQNVASLLTRDLFIDWRAGAEWFQFLLEDHCVGANWGNWMYFSGVGSDPKQRHFRTISQARRYDSEGLYVTKWLPQLQHYTNSEMKLRPWDFDIDWGSPTVDPCTQMTFSDLQTHQASTTDNNSTNRLIETTTAEQEK